MKYLSLIALFISHSFYSQNINIPDANFKNALIVLGIDTNADGDIQITEAEALTALNVSSTNIAALMGIESYQYELTHSIENLTGIEYFVNLESLNIAFNQVNALNISALTNLKTLLCESNNLKNLNLSALNNLENLNCYQNQLTNLNLNNTNSLLSLNIGSNRSLGSNFIESNKSNLTNLTVLKSSSNNLTTINVSTLTNLEELDLYNNSLTELDISSLTKLIKLSCNYNKLTNLNVNTLQNLENLTCDNNLLVNLNLGNTTKITRLICNNNLLTQLDCRLLTNLNYLECSNNELINLNIENLSVLKAIVCKNNKITSLSLNNLNTLQSLKCSFNKLTNLDVSNLNKIEFLDCDNNELKTLSVGSSITLIKCHHNKLTNLDFTNATKLDHLECNDNELVSLYIKNGTNETTFNDSQLTINFGNNPNLQSICCDAFESSTVQILLDSYGYTNCEVSTFCECSTEIVNIPDANFKTLLLNSGVDLNNDGEIQVCEAEGIAILNLTALQTTDLTGLEAFINLKTLNIGWTHFEYYLNRTVTSFDFTTLTKLEYLQLIHAESSYVESINLSGLINLKQINIINCRPYDVDSFDTPEAFINLNIESCTSLEIFDYTNSFLNIDFCQAPSIKNLNCSYLEGGEPEIFDFSCLGKLEILNISENKIDKLILKNGSALTNLNFFDIGFNYPYPNFICIDDIQEEYDIVAGLIGTNTAVNSYCSFTPGGDYYNVQGQISIDLGNNGCTANNSPFPNLKFQINDGTDNAEYISNTTGNYNFSLQQGAYTITPVLENPDYFSISPTSMTVDFSTDEAPFNQNFCLSPIGIKNDLEITLVPLTKARPGFTAYYHLIYKNKGNTKISGSINLTFDDQILDLVFSTPNQDSQSTNTLSWNYTDLKPFESRIIWFSLNLNSPVETPPVNNYDILNFGAAIDPVSNDANQEDNTFTLNQTVVGSFDPNDKTCLEGNTITPDLIGEYVHYLIRCENTGTAEAVNIVIKDIIDTTKLDINTLIITGSSHSMTTKITDNIIEFIFENINLPFDDANNDGYVAFKIKTLSTLLVGDIFENDAEIYFDYNKPIATNTAKTSIEKLLSINKTGTNGLIINIFPNPVEDNLIIKSNQVINAISIYDISGRLINQVSYLNFKNELGLSIKHLLSGTYFLKIKTNQNEITKKVIKT